MWNTLKHWVTDPFGKKSISEKHDPLIEEVWKTKAEVQATIIVLESTKKFPMASTIQRPRRRHYEHN